MSRFRLLTLTVGAPLCVLAACQGENADRDQASAAADPPSAQLPAGKVEPEAVDALKRMSTYLATLNTIEVTSKGSLDAVTDEGQRIQLDGVTNYKVRRPGFVINYVSDMKTRQFIYDGKQFTIYAPVSGYFATVPAPATNREALDQIYDKYGIALPLEDLFRWSDPGNKRIPEFKGAARSGTATLDGVATDHFAFREKDIDWEIWIEQGEQPLPRKLVIVDRTDAARPTFIARLDWKVNPGFSDSDFAFAPNKDAKKIELANFQGSGE